MSAPEYEGAQPSPSRSRSPSPALINLLHAAEDVAFDFAADAGKALRPLVHAALEEEASASPSTASDSTCERLETLVSSVGWDPESATFARPVDPRALVSVLKASMLSDLTLVGEGTYSVVYRAHNRLDGTTVTLKKLRLDGSGEGLPATAVREMSLLRELSTCAHIVSLLDVLYDRSRVYLVLEHLDEDLHQHIQAQGGPCDPSFVRSTLRQILLGVEAAHAHRVIHRDLKPQNILLDRNGGVVKIADLGLSRTFLPATCGSRPMTREVVTLLYRAPELLLGCTTYTTAVDLWSVGCVLGELVLGVPLFAGDSEIGQLYQVFQLLGTPDDGCWPGVTSLPEWQPLFPKWSVQSLSERLEGGGLCPDGIDLLSKLLCLDPDRRPTATQALAHPYFQGFREIRNSPNGSPPTPMS